MTKDQGFQGLVLCGSHSCVYTGAKEVGKGIGLGLAIAHQVISEKHRGSLTAQSKLGEGSIFTLKLPVDIAM